ncbi:MAG TPA: hypothetical protein VEI73_04115 [Candidatus Acidoferrum sp.]|nr:hypothetical protein [Candidatus Acidoferrum sp.]
MNNKISLLFKWLFLILLLPSIAGAQLVVNSGQQAAPQAGPGMATPQTASQNPQAVSQTGLLPMFALDMNFDPTWVDGMDVPSKSPQFSHNGVNDTFQQAWDTLKPAGFNMIRFPIKLDDQQSAVRLANLCVWAKANSVSLIPVLKVAATELKTQSSLANATSALVTAVVARLRQAGDAQFATYTQIAYYQIEGTLNHTGRYPGLTADAAQQALSSASSALRAAELQALQASGVQATPILISASFDFELIRQGGINGVPLDPGAEQKAQASLNQFLAPFVTAQNIDAVNVEWFPGSISSGDASHFASLLRTLKGALPGKQLTLTTGSSSAFNPPNQQVQFYTLAVSNLGDFRASDGVNSSFLGAIFRQAFNGAQANANPPAGTDPTKWDWNAKAQQLNAMWSQGTKADDLAWWVSKVQDNMGLLALQPNATGVAAVTPLPSVSAFQQISTTVAQVSQNVVPPPTAPGAMAPPPPPTGAGMPQAGMPSYPAGTQAASQGYGAANGIPQGYGPASAIPQGAYSSYAAGFQTSAQGYGMVNGVSQAGNPACPGGMQTLPQSYGMQTSPQGYGMVNAMPPSVAPSCLGGMTTGAPNGSAAFQQMMFTILQQFTTQMAGAFATKLSTPSVPGSQLGGYPATNLTSSSAGPGTAYGAGTPGSQSVTTPSVSSPAVPQTPTTSSSSANTVSLGPQDVTVDKSAITAGQAVHFTAQVHNVTANQDLSGLTVALADPSGVLTNLPTQSGVLVAHASTTAVSIPWTPAQSSAAPYQLSVQVLDGSGNQIASTIAPAIAVNSTASTAAGGANAGAGSTSGSGSTSSSGSNSTGTQTSGTPVSNSPVQPQITFFGIANASAATPAGQIPTLLVQVSNPSQNSMQPAKATLSVDGTPGQTQNLGTLLPQQTRSALFSGVSAATGSHTVQVSVTTADGGSASGTANVSASTASSSSGANSGSSGGGTTLPLSGPTVRYGTPTTFQIGAFSQSIAAIPSSGNQFQSQSSSPTLGTANGSTASSTTAAGSNLGSKPSAVRNATGAVGSTSANNLPVRPGQPNASTSTNSPSTSGPVRNITQGTTSSSTPANGGGLVRPGPGGMATNALPSTISRPGGAAPVAEGAIDLSVSMPDIRFTPATPRPGQATTFSALIRNLGTVAVQGAQVSFRLIVDGRQAAISQPLVFNISGQGTFLASWSTLIPPGQQMQIVVAVTANGDVNPANNQAALTFNVGIPGAPARQ